MVKFSKFKKKKKKQIYIYIKELSKLIQGEILFFVRVIIAKQPFN